MFFLSFLGYCGAIRESQCLLTTVSIFFIYVSFKIQARTVVVAHNKAIDLCLVKKVNYCTMISRQDGLSGILLRDFSFAHFTIIEDTEKVITFIFLEFFSFEKKFLCSTKSIFGFNSNNCRWIYLFLVSFPLLIIDFELTQSPLLIAF